MDWIRRRTLGAPKQEQIADRLDYGDSILWPHGRIAVLHSGPMLRRQVPQESPLERLDQKILAWMKEDIRIVPWDPFRGGRLLVIGQLLRQKFDITGSIGYLDSAIDKFEHAIRRLKPPAAEWMAAKAELAFALTNRFGKKKDLEDLNRAIQCRRELEPHVPSGAVELHRNILSGDLSERFQATGSYFDASEAIAMLQSIAESTTDLDKKASYLSSLSNAHLALFQKTRIPEELKRSVETARLSTQVEAENTAASERAVHISRLGRALNESWTYTSAKSDLDDAINAYEKALQLVPKEDQNFLIMQSNLGTLLRQRFDLAGRQNDLKRAFELTQNAVESSPLESVEIPGRVVNLAAVLETKWQANGMSEDLENAIQYIRSAVDITPKEHEHYSTVHGALCRLLQSKFELCASVEDLHEAIDAGERATAGRRNGDAADSIDLDNLATAYHRRYDWLQSTDSLERAIALYEKAVETNSPSADQGSIYLNLSNALQKRYERLEGLKNNEGQENSGADDLPRAIDFARNAVEASRKNHTLMLAKMTLASSLTAKGRRDADLQTLDEAIEVYKSIRMGSSQETYLSRGSMYNNLGTTLRDRYDVSNSRKDLEQMASFYKKALDLTPKDNPTRALYMGNLGGALSELATQTKSTRKKKNAMDLLLRSASDPNLPVSIRIGFLRRTAAAFVGKDEQRVTECLVKATKLMPMLSSRAVAAIDRQFKLSKYPGLASSAAAWLLETGHPVLEVIEVLEIGRGVILGGYFETRSDLTMLKDLHPALGHNLEHLQRQLDHDGKGSETGSILNGSITGNNKGTFQSRLIQQHEEMLQQVRNLPGFQRFLLGPSSKELLTLSQEGSGPLVMLNSHPNRCDAIIVSEGRMYSLPLPSLKFKAIEAYSKLIRALPNQGRTPESMRTLKKILNWLWDSIAKPVLENLGFNSTPAEGATWPKIWWIPTGLLTNFPIHAAGRHAVDSQETVMDRVVSCYTTTIKALDYARKRKEDTNGTSQPSMLLVAMSETPARISLPHALEEVTTVAGMLQNSVSTDVLHQPTKLEVLEGLKKHSMVHFACHGEVDQMNPSKSRLLFSDWASAPLSVEDVVSLRLENVMFAYVSACHSADNQNSALMDEGLHMAGALHLAGYPQLVATLWPVDDEVSKTVSESIYSSVLADGFGKLAAAEALNNAIRKLRDDSRYMDGILLDDDDPFNWAPYIYMGA